MSRRKEGIAITALKRHPIGRLEKIMERMEKLTVVRTICTGLLNITPVLIIGAFAPILKELPVDAYRHFIATFAGARF